MRIDAKRPDDTQDFGDTRTFYFSTRDLAWDFMRVVTIFRAGTPAGQVSSKTVMATTPWRFDGEGISRHTKNGLCSTEIVRSR